MSATAQRPSRLRKGAGTPARLPAPLQPRALTWAERLDILDALSLALTDVYAHLTLKRALYGFDILRGLEHLRQQVTQLTELQFHRELMALMNRLRDAHTQYLGPWSVPNAVASLQFLVEAYGPSDRPTYVVSKVDRRVIKDPHFRAGVTIESWNGVDFDRAVDLYAEVQTGGRPDARRARALESLTYRSLEYTPAPDERWVLIGYRDAAKRLREIRVYWHWDQPDRAPAAAVTLAARMKRAINAGAESVRRAKKQQFNRALWRAERVIRPSSGGVKAKLDAFADFVTGRTVTTSMGRFGYLRLWSFDVEDDVAFVAVIQALLKRMPDRGVILDLRDNPGGNIVAAERALQLFTPERILPTKFGLRCSDVTAAMARAAGNRDDLGPWSESLATAQQTGEPLTAHLPITAIEQCNDIGQQYGGPVVAIVNANTYSSGDLFTAGIVDNRIGPVVCIGEATGAGGANVWGDDDLRAALNAARRSLPTLPRDVHFTVAVRRAVRSGDADGTLIEDAGIRGQPYAMTRDDVFHGNRDLIEHCAALLTTQPYSQLVVQRQGKKVSVRTRGLDHLDLYLDGHPAAAPILLAKDGTRHIALDSAAGSLEVVGFSGGVVRQRRRLPG